VAALKFACGKFRLCAVNDGKLRNGEVKSSVCHERHRRVEKEENCMKLILVFVVAAVVVTCLKGIKRDSKDESASSFHRLGL
jgi:hypothetical protein